MSNGARRGAKEGVQEERNEIETRARMSDGRGRGEVHTRLADFLAVVWKETAELSASPVHRHTFLVGVEHVVVRVSKRVTVCQRRRLGLSLDAASAVSLGQRL